VECTCVFDEKGSFGPKFGDRKERILADQIILAVGQSVDLSFLSVGDSRRDFAEIDLGYDQTQARKEARRCLQCDVRLYLKSNPAPTENLVTFTYL